MSAIAITGMACRYAQARSPRQLWENVLAQRQSFRRIPAVRLRVEDYAPGSNDESISLQMAAVLEDYEFDRVRFHVSRETFVSTDLVHWLALDIASQALEDAKLLDLGNSQRERVGVYIGNSLTGEFSRANLMRLRWPYVRRVLAATLQQKNVCGSNAQINELLDAVEERYKDPFPATTEDSLAGGLANTIAGRICNYFNFKGGGYTVDGACASSLLAVTTACSALESGDVDIAIAGGVDLSLDPFELAGFSKLGALARERMRVFDEHSSGFWPGEGCGMVVLMRHEDAVAAQHLPYAVIRGWGVSSDGSGGITRPEAGGQMLALKRAYQRAGYGIDSVAYFEGHGTGTSVGDAAELQALSAARREAAPYATPTAIGSIKANIGHTKAAAGVAGLIKAALAAKTRIVPPITGCDTPHPELTAGKPMLRTPREGELWPENLPARAGVSAMGFGGINTHVALEAADTFHRKNFTGSERQQLSSAQDCELFLVHAANLSELSVRLEEMLGYAGQISYSEMTDLAASLAASMPGNLPESAHGVRAACVASTPAQLEENLKKLREWCVAGTVKKIDTTQGIFLGTGDTRPQIGFLFPGQGSPVYTSGGIWPRRFPAVRDVYRKAHLPTQQTVATETAQPCVVTASLAGLLVLDSCGIEAAVALGHSLGELTALCWGGACEKDDLLRVVAERGRVMAQKGASSGAMASVRADAQEVKRRLNGDRLVIAAYNSPQQTVVSGDARALESFLARLASAGVNSTRLPVSHAFHSPLVEDVAAAFSSYLSTEDFNGMRRRVISTVTGTTLENNADLRELLAAQITSPVRFAEAVAVAAKEMDLFIEVGPGAVLTGIAAECSDKPVVAMNCGSESLRGLLSAVGAAFAVGANVCASALFESRFYRPFQAHHTFLANPCESTASYEAPARTRRAAAGESAPAPIAAGNSAIEVLRQLVAKRTELPLATVKPESRFLDDLHLNSITVGQLVLEAATQLGLPAPVAPTEYANATLAETAATLEGMKRNAAPEQGKFPPGVETWTRVLGVELAEQELRKGNPQAVGHWEIVTLVDSPLRRSLEQEFRAVSNDGMVCIVPEEHEERSAAYLLEFVQTVLQRKAGHVVFVQHQARGGASAFARTLSLENPAIQVKVVVIPREHPDAAAWVAAEATSAARFTEAHYDHAAIRREPRLKVLWPDQASANAFRKDLGREDVLLVSGGGKGIAAECALELARATGCALALVGRSDAARDQELKQNLLRMTQAGVRFGYFAADVTDRTAIAAVISDIEREMGKITAVLHGAGVNHPKRLEEITAADLHETLSPKLAGLENILNAVDAHPLRLLITFGSIIGRAGLQGEGHYALANDWLGYRVEEWQEKHSHCRCLNLEWSVWAGAGMGQKLGVLEALVRQGITPLPMGEAIAMLKSVLAAGELPVSTIVTGRFGNLRTMQLESAELPLRRFLEHVRVHYPGVELVADAVLSVDSDPYVAEHAFQGEQLFPAVCGMEAITQVAMALQQTEQIPQLHHVRFEQPIVVPRNKPVTIRIAALRRNPHTVSVVVRCASTGFHVDHFSAECSFQGKERESKAMASRPETKIALDIEHDVYDGLLFHQGRFRRIHQYKTLEASCSVAEISGPSASLWFARHLPQEFAIGDPASRDAAIHSIQACIPHKTVLPVGVDRIVAGASWTQNPATIHAVERVRDGDNFMYDLEIRDAQGKVCESWQGLHLRVVAPIARSTPWPVPLLGPYLERRLGELLASVPLKITLASGPHQQRGQRSAGIVRQAFGAEAILVHRGDGKPEIASEEHSVAGVAVAELAAPQVSLSHAASLTLLVSGEQALGCDMEQVIMRDSQTWQGLLGAEALGLAQFVAGKTGCSLNVADTQIWTLQESLRKAGASFDESLRVESHTNDHWTVLRSGHFAAAIYHAQVEGFDSEFAFGFVIHRTQ